MTKCNIFALNVKMSNSHFNKLRSGAKNVNWMLNVNSNKTWLEILVMKLIFHIYYY